MNQLFYNRSAGILGPHAFARIQTTQLIRAIQPCPKIRFDGGEKEAVPQSENVADIKPMGKESIWAHQAGVNALALDVDGRMLVSSR